MESDQNTYVERVAKALYQQALERALLDVSVVNFDISNVKPVFRKLERETDTGIAIVTAAYLDDCLKRLLSINVDISNQKLVKNLFDLNGPMGTFSSRIDLALGFSLISNAPTRD